MTANLQPVTPDHLQLMDLMIENPEWDTTRLAAQIGRSRVWVASVRNTDAFREGMRSRGGLLLEDNLRGVLDRTIENLQVQLAHSSVKELTHLLAVTTEALGLVSPRTLTQSNVVYNIPRQEKSLAKWEEKYAFADSELTS